MTQIFCFSPETSNRLHFSINCLPEEEQLHLHISISRVPLPFLSFPGPTNTLHRTQSGERLFCFFFTTVFFVAYGAYRAVHCSQEWLCLLLKL